MLITNTTKSYILKNGKREIQGIVVCGLSMLGCMEGLKTKIIVDAVKCCNII